MRHVRMAVFAGIATLGVAGTALAANDKFHVMSVDLPDGSIAKIEYAGDVAPRVKIDRGIQFVPVGFEDVWDEPELNGTADRVFANMDRQLAKMMQQLRSAQTRLDAQPGPGVAAFGNGPATLVSYRFVSTGDGQHACTQSWQWTSQGAGAQPKLVSAKSGDCAESGTRQPAPAKAVAPRDPATTV